MHPHLDAFDWLKGSDVPRLLGVAKGMSNLFIMGNHFGMIPGSFPSDFRDIDPTKPPGAGGL